jgi:UDP-galactopyranose mutase
MKGDVIVVGLHLRWAGVWQRPNHVLSRLAAFATIVVVEEEFPGERDETLIAEFDGIVVVTPVRLAPARGVDAQTIRDVRNIVRDRIAMLWLYTPLMLDLADAVPQAPIVYDKMDDLAAFKDADPRLRECEDRLLARADFVFAGGRTLWEGVKDRVRAGAAVPSGVEVEHYASAVGAGRLAAFSALSGPVFGYIGVLDERLDLDLIVAVARARPDATLAFIGPVAKIDPASLPSEPNIYYGGKQSYDLLPAYMASFDVAIMPFAKNDATRSISPTKTLEYLAARRPVVSTAIADVVSDFGDIVYVARDALEFVAALAVAERGDAEREARGIARAAAMSWDAIVAGMIGSLERCGITLANPSETCRSHYS